MFEVANYISIILAGVAVTVLINRHNRRWRISQKRAEVYHNALGLLDHILFEPHLEEQDFSSRFSDLRHQFWLYASDRAYTILATMYALSINSPNSKITSPKLLKLYRQLVVLIRRDLYWNGHTTLGGDDFFRPVVAHYDRYKKTANPKNKPSKRYSRKNPLPYPLIRH